MKRILNRMTLLLIHLVLCNSLFAEEFFAKQPILITSAGQSGDVLMAKILAQKANLQFTYDNLAKAERIKNHATLIIVCGGSSKGLGAAKIDKDQEIARVQALISEAKKANLKILVMHLGGKARRGQLSDEFNKIAADNADYLIVVKSGDEDRFFSDIAEQKKIRLALIEKIMDASDYLKKIFVEEKKH